MNKRSNLVIVLIAVLTVSIAALSIVCFYLLSTRILPALAEERALEDSPAASFRVLDSGEEERELGEVLGTRPVVLNYWATWAAPCMEELPLFQDAFEEYGDRVDFWMLDMAEGEQETLEQGRAYVEEMGYTFPLYFDTRGHAAWVYGVSVLPTTIFIRADGTVLKTHRGPLTERRLERYLGQLLES